MAKAIFVAESSFNSGTDWEQRLMEPAREKYRRLARAAIREIRVLEGEAGQSVSASGENKEGQS